MTPDDSPDWERFDSTDEDWVMGQVSAVIDGTLAQLRAQMKPCEIADVWRRFGPRIVDSVELHVRRRASALANAMRAVEAETHDAIRH